MAKEKQPARNTRNIYQIPGGWYLNWQAMGQVYREAFMSTSYGDSHKAFAAAKKLRDLLESRRPEIEKKMGKLLGKPTREAGARKPKART